MNVRATGGDRELGAPGNYEYRPAYLLRTETCMRPDRIHVAQFDPTECRFVALGI